MKNIVIEKYGDIIDLPHHKSKKHSPMIMEDRAAQFSPFAALTGHAESIKERARLTQKFIELTEEKKAELDAKFSILESKLSLFPEIRVTYFSPDKKKEGGEYVELFCVVKKIDMYKRLILTCTGTSIPIDRIYSLDGDIFEEIF